MQLVVKCIGELEGTRINTNDTFAPISYPALITWMEEEGIVRKKRFKEWVMFLDRHLVTHRNKMIADARRRSGN